MPKIKAMYKTYNTLGTKLFVIEEYGSWSEDGSYTVFYKSYSEDSASLIVPTKNVCWIRIAEQ